MKSAKFDMMAIILGMIMVIAGVFYLLTKIRFTSDFFTGSENWPLWYSLVSLIPLAVGIILMLIIRNKWWPRIIGIVGAVLALVAIANRTTLHLQNRLAGYQWVLIGTLVIGGLLIVAVSLLIEKKETHEKR